jgi:hypothetical protein
MSNIEVSDIRNRTSGESVSFQIALGNRRQDFSLQTNLPTKEQARKYLLQNWPTIRQMARDRVENQPVKDGAIKLAMI